MIKITQDEAVKNRDKKLSLTADKRSYSRSQVPAPLSSLFEHAHSASKQDNRHLRPINVSRYCIDLLSDEVINVHLAPY